MIFSLYRFANTTVFNFKLNLGSNSAGLELLVEVVGDLIHYLKHMRELAKEYLSL